MLFGAAARYRRLRERYRALRQPHETHRLLRRDRHGQRLRVGHADVLRREDHDAPRDEERILSRLQHPRQPVDRRVRVGAAHRLDERGDRVVVGVARLVVAERAALERLLHQRAVHALRAVRVRLRDFDGEFQSVERDAGVAGGGVLQERERVRLQRRV